ncbi:MAG: sulfurtransferase [Methylococcaceae bacterium]|jgi:thiosulfate/3-mercaptopyruvate sulfurtransferase
MNYNTLISADSLYTHQYDKHWIIVDCRFALTDANFGIKAYRAGHLPNARYAHLNLDLSSEVQAYTGRHPLPNLSSITKKLGLWGINNQSQVVAYDDAAGSFAARFWWLLRHLGHDKVAVLDGGIQHWQRLGYPLTTKLPAVKAEVFRAYPSSYNWLTARQVENLLATKTVKLIDARANPRYLGQHEPIDPVAGHIPGALNHPFTLNLNGNGLFKSADALRQQLQQLLGKSQPQQSIHMCGSGVTACHNLLAMEHAGLTGSTLYAGSWSEWIRDKNRAISVG